VFSLTVKSSGYPLPAFSETGTLPAGVSFTDSGNGTAALAGAPDAGAGGAYTVMISATNTAGNATQAFNLTVLQPPVITSAASATATSGTAFSFTFTATGYPLPAISHTGTVRGLTFTSHGNGTATLAGVPKIAGTYTLTITVTNSSGTSAQAFTLKVVGAADPSPYYDMVFGPFHLVLMAYPSVLAYLPGKRYSWV
jgi:hypothetical protein